MPRSKAHYFFQFLCENQLPSKDLVRIRPPCNSAHLSRRKPPPPAALRCRWFPPWCRTESQWPVRRATCSQHKGSVLDASSKTWWHVCFCKNETIKNSTKMSASEHCRHIHAFQQAFQENWNWLLQGFFCVSLEPLSDRLSKSVLSYRHPLWAP